jgi:type IV secretory pathway ATPase VirB11/archaellum biosynthesis ATPase
MANVHSIVTIPLLREAEAAEKVFREAVSGLKPDVQAASDVLWVLKEFARRPEIRSMSVAPVGMEFWVQFLDSDMRAVPVSKQGIGKPGPIAKISEEGARLLFQMLQIAHSEKTGTAVGASMAGMLSDSIGPSTIRWEFGLSSTQQPYIFARRATLENVMTLTDLRARGTLDDEAYRVVLDIVRWEGARSLPKVVFAGGPAAGKTTLMNACLLQAYRTFLSNRTVLAIGEVSDYIPPPQETGVLLAPFPPGSFSEKAMLDMGVRANATAVIVGEITYSTANIVLSMLHVMPCVLGTIHCSAATFVERMSELSGRTVSPAMLGNFYVVQVEMLETTTGRESVRRVVEIRRIRDDGAQEVLYKLGRARGAVRQAPPR